MRPEAVAYLMRVANTWPGRVDADPLGRLAELGERAAVPLRERLEAGRVAAHDGQHHGRWRTVWAFEITAEVVDKAETFALLKIMGFDYVQGFHIAPATARSVRGRPP